MSRILHDILHSLFSWLFPSRTKEAQIEHLTLDDVMTFPKASQTHEHVTSLFSYKDSRVRSLIWEMKYYKNSHAYTLITPLCADTIEDLYRHKQTFYGWKNCLLIPVPIHDNARKEKGFAHLETLCSFIVPHLPDSIIYSPHILIKTKETVSQSKIHDRKKRLTNVAYTQKATQNLADAHIILIDDVYTTGATVHESIRALNEAGARDIIVFTIAH